MDLTVYLLALTGIAIIAFIMSYKIGKKLKQIKDKKEDKHE